MSFQILVGKLEDQNSHIFVKQCLLNIRLTLFYTEKPKLTMSHVSENAWGQLFEKQHSTGLNAQNSVESLDSYFFIYDCIGDCPVFTSNAFDIVTGYQSTEFDFQKLLSMIHPDDIDFFNKCREESNSFTDRLSFAEHFQYIFSYCYRIILASGEVFLIEHRRQAIEVDALGKLSKILVQHKRSKSKEEEIADSFKIFDRRINAYVEENANYNLTKRELEIVKLVNEGLSSVDISVHLNISKLTVDTHRKKILGKSNCANFLELYRKMNLS